MNRELCLHVARHAVESQDIESFCCWFRRAILPQIPESPADENAKTWHGVAARFLTLSPATIKGDRLPFKVFVQGNGKLPFYAFSVLAIVTCPGAGSCADWCYSLRAWRNPQAFFRQLQNTLLMLHCRRAIARAVTQLQNPARRVVRLYVDGDFDSVESVLFWMTQCERKPHIVFYGYSKSWHELLHADARLAGNWPQNYVLNVSDGSVHDHDNITRERILRLPVTRGAFRGVPIRGKYSRGFKRYTEREYHREVRDALRSIEATPRVVSCPGQCGDCKSTQAGIPLCADITARMPIGIGIH